MIRLDTPWSVSSGLTGDWSACQCHTWPLEWPRKIPGTRKLSEAQVHLLSACWPFLDDMCGLSGEGDRLLAWSCLWILLDLASLCDPFARLLKACWVVAVPSLLKYASGSGTSNKGRNSVADGCSILLLVIKLCWRQLLWRNSSFKCLVRACGWLTGSNLKHSLWSLYASPAIWLLAEVASRAEITSRRQAGDGWARCEEYRKVEMPCLKTCSGNEERRWRHRQSFNPWGLSKLGARILIGWQLDRNQPRVMI